MQLFNMIELSHMRVWDTYSDIILVVTLHSWSHMAFGCHIESNVSIVHDKCNNWDDNGHSRDCQTYRHLKASANFIIYFFVFLIINLDFLLYKMCLLMWSLCIWLWVKYRNGICQSLKCALTVCLSCCKFKLTAFKVAYFSNTIPAAPEMTNCLEKGNKNEVQW